MPAVHHKLLLEDALQDSPQVGLRLFSHVCVPSCLIKGVTSAEVSLAQTVSSIRCSLFPLVDDSSQLTHCYKNCNPPVSSSCTFQSLLQHVTVILFFVSVVFTKLPPFLGIPSLCQRWFICCTSRPVSVTAIKLHQTRCPAIVLFSNAVKLFWSKFCSVALLGLIPRMWEGFPLSDSPGISQQSANRAVLLQK